MDLLRLAELLGGVSLVTFLASIILIPWLVNRLPADYFNGHWKKKEQKRVANPLYAMGVLIVRNALGVLLVVAGLVMLVLPGQGILTMLIGFCFMDFPYKTRFVQLLVHKQAVQNALNWVRRKGNKQPFLFVAVPGKSYGEGKG